MRATCLRPPSQTAAETSFRAGTLDFYICCSSDTPAPEMKTCLSSALLFWVRCPGLTSDGPATGDQDGPGSGGSSRRAPSSPSSLDKSQKEEAPFVFLPQTRLCPLSSEREAPLTEGALWGHTLRSLPWEDSQLSPLTTSTDLFHGSLVSLPLLHIIAPVGSCPVQFRFQFLNLLHVTGPSGSQAGYLLHQPVVLSVLEKNSRCSVFIPNKEAFPWLLTAFNMASKTLKGSVTLATFIIVRAWMSLLVPVKTARQSRSVPVPELVGSFTVGPSNPRAPGNSRGVGG